jgi:hypothetical protein
MKKNDQIDSTKKKNKNKGNMMKMMMKKMKKNVWPVKELS